MHPPRLILRRLLSQPPRRHALLLRTFAQHTTTSPTLRSSRPQLPFLSIPSRQRAAPTPQQFRYLTTERKRWLRHELLLSVRYTLVLWAIAVLGGAAYFVADQEFAERRYPTPHEWSFWTRQRLRAARWQRDNRGGALASPDWVSVVSAARDVVRRLEDPAVDGAGLVDADVKRKEVTPEGTKDISAKHENWRRGYYEALMLYAEAAEHVDGWVVDRTRGVVFPPDVVLGPSNPRPIPIPNGAKSAPREEDCDPAFAPADDIYLKIIATEGFTARQRMDAALALANYYEFKHLPGPAAIMLEDAVNLAQSAQPSASSAQLNPKTWAIKDKAGPVSENLLRSLTAYATFKARHGDVASALPVLISILQARRILPKTSPQQDSITTYRRPHSYGNGILAHIIDTVRNTFQPPPYPPPPPDGSAPPARDARERCEEAALHLHLGEIVYASAGASRTGREDGLAWTRDAVDMAEEQLHRLGGGGSGGSSDETDAGLRGATAAEDKDARATCRECLAAGLENWAHMVGRMAREEAEKERAETKPAEGQTSFGWLGLWGEGRREQPGRWAAEEVVVLERSKRARGLLEDLDPPAKGLLSWFQA